MNSLVMLMDSPLPTQADAVLQKSWVTYMPVTAWCSSSSEDSCLTIQENHAVISGAGTTGLRTWEAALHLGSYLLSSEEAASLVSGKAVLELGAGTGFLSVLCAQNLDAKHVIATDGDLGVIEALRENIQFNEVADKVSAGTFRWADALKGTLVGGEMKGQPLDTVLGADVVRILTTIALKALADSLDIRQSHDSSAHMHDQGYVRRVAACGGHHLGYNP